MGDDRLYEEHIPCLCHSSFLPLSIHPLFLMLLLLLLFFVAGVVIWEQGIKWIIPFGNRQAASVLESFLFFSNINIVEYHQEGAGWLETCKIDIGGLFGQYCLLKHLTTQEQQHCKNTPCICF